MLERITNFMSHPELLLRIPDFDDSERRFIEVVRFYLSGFHILPPVRFPFEITLSLTRILGGEETS